MTIATSVQALVWNLDITRAAATVYTAALLATVPVIIAGIAAFVLRRGTAEARSLVWRSAIGALLIVFVGRQLPLHWTALVVPSSLAAPLVALGRARMMVSSAPSGTSLAPGDFAGNAPQTISVVRLLMLVYGAGIVVVLLPTVAFALRSRSRLARATRVTDPTWIRILEDVRVSVGIRRPIRMFFDDSAVVPMTWGVLRPVVALPWTARDWTDSQRRIVVLHELLHVRGADWAFKITGRLVCALYWFHPGAWWIARGLHDDCELACDDRVIGAGVRRSDYAELLVTAADRLQTCANATAAALALSQRGGLRGRLAAVLDARHGTRPLRREWAVVAAAVTLVLVCPVSAVQLAPTREVLTTLMRDTRWESRAYAVVGLAQRGDSIAEARSAAEADPSPRVRAWARYALGESTEAPGVLPSIRNH